MATIVTGVTDKETRSSRPAEEKHSAHSNSTVEIEYTSQVQQEPAKGQGPEGSCNGEAENAESDMAIVNYCIRLAAEEDAAAATTMAAEGAEGAAVAREEQAAAPCSGGEKAADKAESADRNKSENTCAGYGQQTWMEETVAAEEALMQYCIELAAPSAEDVVV